VQCSAQHLSFPTPHITNNQHKRLPLNHQADNTVRIINMASMRVECTVHGLRPPPHPAPGGRAGGCAVLQPGSGQLVVSGPNALLQFFDASRERHVARLQVRMDAWCRCLVLLIPGSDVGCVTGGRCVLCVLAAAAAQQYQPTLPASSACARCCPLHPTTTTFTLIPPTAHRSPTPHHQNR